MNNSPDRYKEMVAELEIAHQALQEKSWILALGPDYRLGQSSLKLTLGGLLLLFLCVLLPILLTNPMLSFLFETSSRALIGSVVVMVIVLDVVWLYQVWNEHSMYKQMWEQQKSVSQELRSTLEVTERVLNEIHWSGFLSDENIGESI